MLPPPPGPSAGAGRAGDSPSQEKLLFRRRTDCSTPSETSLQTPLVTAACCWHRKGLEAEDPSPRWGAGCLLLVPFLSQFLHLSGTHSDSPRSRSCPEARVARSCVKCWSPSLHIMQPGIYSLRSDYGTSLDRKWRSGNRNDNPPMPVVPKTFPGRTVHRTCVWYSTDANLGREPGQSV